MLGLPKYCSKKNCFKERLFHEWDFKLHYLSFLTFDVVTDIFKIAFASFRSVLFPCFLICGIKINFYFETSAFKVLPSKTSFLISCSKHGEWNLVSPINSPNLTLKRIRRLLCPIGFRVTRWNISGQTGYDLFSPWVNLN